MSRRELDDISNRAAQIMASGKDWKATVADLQDEYPRINAGDLLDIWSFISGEREPHPFKIGKIRPYQLNARQQEAMRDFPPEEELSASHPGYIPPPGWAKYHSVWNNVLYSLTQGGQSTSKPGYGGAVAYYKNKIRSLGLEERQMTEGYEKAVIVALTDAGVLGAGMRAWFDMGTLYINDPYEKDAVIAALERDPDIFELPPIEVETGAAPDAAYQYDSVQRPLGFFNDQPTLTLYDAVHEDTPMNDTIGVGDSVRMKDAWQVNNDNGEDDLIPANELGTVASLLKGGDFLVQFGNSAAVVGRGDIVKE